MVIVTLATKLAPVSNCLCISFGTDVDKGVDFVVKCQSPIIIIKKIKPRSAHRTIARHIVFLRLRYQY